MTTSRTWIAAAVIGISLCATAVQAAPAGGLAGAGEALKTEAASGGAEPVRWVCFSNHWGRRVCSWRRPHVFGFYAAPRWHYGYGYRRFY